MTLFLTSKMPSYLSFWALRSSSREKQAYPVLQNSDQKLSQKPMKSFGQFTFVKESQNHNMECHCTYDTRSVYLNLPRCMLVIPGSSVSSKDLPPRLHWNCKVIPDIGILDERGTRKSLTCRWHALLLIDSRVYKSTDPHPPCAVFLSLSIQSLTCSPSGCPIHLLSN